MVSVIKPNWPANKRIHAYTTTRQGGLSEAPFDSLNMTASTGDNETHVIQNRALVQTKLQIPKEPLWLTQTHSTTIINAARSQPKLPEADASYSHKAGVVCCVLTADCLPVLICNQQANCIAAIHAGWRGLANGVLETTLEALSLEPADTLVWLGPAIGPTAFEVGADVYHAFVDKDERAKTAFMPLTKDKWLGNIYSLAYQRLSNYHITSIYGGQYCTFTEPDKFYSYRRDGKQSGRMATFIWFSDA